MENNNNIQQENTNIENNNIQKVNDNEQQLMPVKNSNGLIGFLIVVILLLLIGLVYVLFIKDGGENGSNNPTPTPEVTPIPSETKDVTPTPVPVTPPSEGDYELTVYRYKEGKHLTDDTEIDEGLEIAFTIKTNTADAKLLNVNYNNKYIVLYNDNGIYIYNSKTQSKEKIELESSYEDYSMYFNEKYDNVIGIGYINKNKEYGYYNLSKKIKLYDKKYIIEDLWAANQINDHYLTLESNKTDYLLSTDSEMVKLSNKDDSGMYYFDSFGSNGNYMYAYAFSPDTICYTKFYGKNFNPFYEDTDMNICEGDVTFVNNKLYIYDGQKILKYTTDGDSNGGFTKYKDVKILYGNYVVYVNDGNLIVENIENNSESKVITKWNEDYYLDDLMTSDYSRTDLEELEENNKKAGFYIVIYYGSKDSNGNYGMEYCYNKGEELVTYPIKEEMGGRAKPVLYLYPQEETNVTVKFAHPEYLTTTYPKYINSWNVRVLPNGDMKDKDGKYYYALYWDETRYSEVDFKEGFYVESQDAIKFLEEKLTIIGLNDKERNEFIMYWLPIMEKNGKNLVYFELTEEREKDNKLIITPTPDSLLRVSIHIKKVNEKASIKEQKLPTFNRYGFVAIEWGGMTY